MISIYEEINNCDCLISKSSKLYKMFQIDCLSKIGDYKILLEFNNMGRKKSYKLVKIFFPLNYEEKRKLEKNLEWLEI